MESLASSDSYEWAVCKEIPIIAKDTEWWNTVIWDDCWFKLKHWPNKYCKNKEMLIINENEHIQKIINEWNIICKFWDQEFARKDIIKHWSNCSENKLKPLIINEALHPCWLYKQNMANKWYCDGINIIKHGWTKYGTDLVIQERGVAWTCQWCESNFCEQCIREYSEINDYNKLRSFSIDNNKHLTHCHPFTLEYGANLLNEIRLCCYGKYKKGGCNGEGCSTLRYLQCLECKFILWEKWFWAPSDDYLEIVPSDIHEHLFHLYSIPALYTWECDKQTKKCVKKDHESNKLSRISYRWDIWDFDIWVECLKFIKR